MDNKLVLITSAIFKEHNLIDEIRQTFLDLEKDPDIEEIQIFLQESRNYLDKDLDIMTANELFTTITSCFSHYGKELISEFNEFLQKSRSNSNYIIITSYIISELIQIEPQLTLPDYHSFVNDALKEILPQIENRNENELTIFDHKITSNFEANLIVNLLLSSNLTEKLISDYFPYLIHQSNISLLSQKVTNSKIIKNLNQTAESNNELFEFITNKNFSMLDKMTEPSKSLIERAVFFTKSEGKKDDEIEGLTKETVLQFTAVCSVYLQKNKFFSRQSINNLIFEGIEFLNETSNSPVLFASLNEILLSYSFIIEHNLISFESILRIIDTLTSRPLNDEIKMSLFETIFDLTFKLDYANVRQFFISKGSTILPLLLENLNDINKNEKLKKRKLNFNAFDLSIILNKFEEVSSVQEATQLIYFIVKKCINVPRFENSEDLIMSLLLFLNEVIQEGSWDDVLLIGQFMKDIGGYEELQEFKEEETMPSYVKESLFGYVVTDQDSIESLIEKILDDPKAELKEQSFRILFNKLIQDKEMLHGHLLYVVNRYRDSYLSVVQYMTVFLMYFQKYQDDFINVTNECFYFNSNEGILLKKINFNLDSFPTPEIGYSIVLKLYDVIEKGDKNQTFQAFYILKNLCASFPFLFSKDPMKLINLVMPFFDDYKITFNSIPNDVEFQRIKTVYAAFIFFLTTMQCVNVLDTFIVWYFKNIKTLSDSQNVAFLIIVRIVACEPNLKVYINSLMWKYDLFKSLGEILVKESHDKTTTYYLRINIFIFLEDIFSVYQDMTRHEVILIDLLQKTDKPFNHVFNKLLLTYPCSYMYTNIKFTSYSPQLIEFIRIIRSHRETDLWFNYHNDIPIKPDISIIQYFVSKLNLSENIDFDLIPQIDGPFSIKMIKHIFSNPKFIYDIVFLDEKFSIVSEMFEKFLVVIEELSDMKNNENSTDEDEDDKDMSTINVFDVLLPHICQQSLFSNLINVIMYGSIDEQNFNVFINIFDRISNQNDVSFISLMSLFSDCLKVEHMKFINDNTKSSFNNGILKFIEFLLKVNKNDVFIESFSFSCGDELLDILLSPNCRNESLILTKAADLYLIFPDESLPDRITHLISFLFKMGRTAPVQAALKLCYKLTKEQREIVNYYIMKSFNNEISKGDIPNIFIKMMNQFPSDFNTKHYQITELLKKYLDDYSKSELANKNIEKDENLDRISFLINFVAPKRDSSCSLSINYEQSSVIPQTIMQTSPTFWNLYTNHMNWIMSKIEKDPLLLNKFKFLLNYPELIPFNSRSLYFRKEIKSLIDSSQKLVINVQSDNILKSSFESLKNKNGKEFLSHFNVIFDNNKTVDHGGVTCDWLTKLSKEIFNKDNGYFKIINKTMNIQPNILSINKEDYLEFFYFAGQVVARALIEGVCIDAHLTIPFYKYILHRKPKLSDLQFQDIELYNSCVWMLENDVNALEMVFEVYDETGQNQTIPLKENGIETKVTNENIKEYVTLLSNYHMGGKVINQINKFVDGFDSVIPHTKISFFTPNELDLLICGVPEIDVEDFKAHTVISEPYTKDSPVIKLFFNVISRWNNEQLVKLFQFMTGCSRMASNGFEEFCQISGRSLYINSGGDPSLLPQAHTCVNTLSLPNYDSEEVLEKKLKQAITMCDSFEII